MSSKEVKANKEAKPATVRSASKRPRQNNQSSAQGEKTDKAKVVSPRPPQGSSTQKDSSALSSRRQAAAKVGSKKEETKTLETSIGASGSTAQVNRGSQGSNSNADLLKQSIRSEKVFDGSLNS